MIESGKAVFLSYASQDAEAARRICDALRAAGVEVWFDQSELVGGDAWDQKIRKQIKECALLVPIISANTNARAEGYFRLEWRLADQRTHLMGKSKAFLLPVCIDDTRDSAADVPDSFTAVQWTRLPNGEGADKFSARVVKLLGGSDAGASLDGARGRRQTAPPQETSRTARDGNPAWFKAVIIVVPILAGLAFAWKVIPRGSVAPATSVKPAAPAADPELATLRAQLVPDRWQKEDYEAMAPRLDRIIKNEPDNAEAWALRSLIESLQVTRNFDAGTKPLESGKADAERALRLAPKLPLANLAMGMHLVAMISRGGDAEACRPWIDQAVAALPVGPLTRYCDGVSRWLSYDFATSDRAMHAWLEAEPHAGFPNWIMAQLNLVARRPDQAEQFANEAARDDGITGIRARYTLFESSYYLRADLPKSREILQGIPANGSTVHRVVHARWLVAMAQHRWDDALQELARLPENFLFDRAFHGPKALLAGLAHARAGRADAANAQFREAERLLREHLATDPDNEELHAVLAVTLACLGRSDEAHGELALVEPLVNGRPANVYRGSLVVLITQARGLLGDFGPMATWARKLFAEKSAFAFSPASFVLDPRFSAGLDAPEIRALLQEFASLDNTASSVKADEKSVAVLAFADLSEKHDSEYFSDGISEELLNVLAKVPGLKVSARTSAFSFKGKETPIPEIAKQLGVAYVVEGSVRRQGDKVRITAQLIKADGGFHVWSDTFTRDLKDMFAVQDEIAGLIAQNLRAKMSLEHERSAISPEVYAQLLKARHAAAQQNITGAREAAQLYREVVSADPTAADAWAELAYCYQYMARFGGMATVDGMREARLAARKALELNPDQPFGLAASGWVQRTDDYDWRGAVQSFRRALAVAPENVAIMGDAAICFLNVGRVDEAIALARQAAERDPLNPQAHWSLGAVLLMSGHAAEAVPAYRRAIELAPAADEYHSHLARALTLLNRLEEAKAIALAEPSERYRLTAFTGIYFRAGDTVAAEKTMAELQTKYGDSMSGYIAASYAAAGKSDEAFRWLDRACAARDASVAWFKTNIFIDSLRSDPRWPVFLRKLGLADDQLK